MRDTLYRRLQPFRHLHDYSGCLRLERWPGGTCTHWKSAALPRRTPEAGDINCQMYDSRFPKGAKIGDLSFVILSLLTTYGRFEPHEEE